MRHNVGVCVLLSLVVMMVGGCGQHGAVTRENCASIQVGMSEQEVISILGRAADDDITYTDSHTTVCTWFANPDSGNDDIDGVVVGFRDGSVSEAILTGRFK